MHLTPVRLAPSAPLALVLALVVGACGQVTGLSDDYTYDLEGGVRAADAASEGAATGDGATGGDGARDATADATNKCTATQSAKTTLTLENYNGTAVCKACLATSCCMAVDTCALNTECDKVLGCKLDCTQQPTADRTQCFKSCTTSGNPNSLYATTVGTCSASGCKPECGLQ